MRNGLPFGHHVAMRHGDELHVALRNWVLLSHGQRQLLFLRDGHVVAKCLLIFHRLLHCERDTKR